jgi:hypothetical protein
MSANYCINCKWCRGSGGWEKCAYPIHGRNLVGLEPSKLLEYCGDQRAHTYRLWHPLNWVEEPICGSEGRWFEPVEKTNAA